MTRPGLTHAERAVFAIIRSELVAGRVAPSFAEMMTHLDLSSTSGIHRLVKSLVAKGYITSSGRKRDLALVPGAESYTVHLPADVDARLSEHVAAWASTPEAVITKAVAEYLARRP